MGHAYEVLKRRRPGGFVEGNNPAAYLGRTIAAECLKCLRDQLTPCRRIAGRTQVPIQAAEGAASGGGESILRAIIAAEEFEALHKAIDCLAGDQREIIRSCFGMDGPQLTLEAISKKNGVSIPTIAKRRDRALEVLRIKLVGHAS